jgi:hypothetical protein
MRKSCGALAASSMKWNFECGAQDSHSLHHRADLRGKDFRRCIVTQAAPAAPLPASFLLIFGDGRDAFSKVALR